MNRPISKKISVVINVLFLVSMNHWIGWNYRQLFSVVGGLLLILMFRHSNISLDFSKRNIISVIFLFGGYLYSMFGFRGIMSPVFITQIFSFGIPITTMICLSNSDKLILFDYITRWFAYLMIPAIVLYFITLNTTPPSFGVTHWVNEELAETGYGECYNYLFYLKPVFFEGDELIRFRGPFLEPGHLGMVCAFILFANHHDYSNKSNLVILASLVLSFSLAGYMLGLIGFLFSYYYQGKIKLKNFIMLVGLLCGFVAVGQNYNDGNNPVNELILSRLKSDEEKGISGNNRNSDYTDYLFASMWSDLDLVLNGYSKDFIEYGQDDSSTRVSGTGVVKFFVLHGLLGLFGAFIFYIYYALNSTNRKFAYLAIAFFILLFLQRCYFAWYSWIICYIAAITRAELKKCRSVI